MAQTTLSNRFAALQAEREQSWPPAQLARNTAQRRQLVESHDPARQAAPGTMLPAFSLIDQDGAALSRDRLTANGPAVLVYFRFGGCPACTIALPYYNEALWPRLKSAGIPLVAVSAQIPADPELIARHGLGFAVASDPGYALARHLGITFFPEEQPTVMPGEKWIGATLGTDSYEITKPAIVILNDDGSLRYLEASPDWLIRPEADAIIAHLPEVVTAPAEA